LTVLRFLAETYKDAPMETLAEVVKGMAGPDNDYWPEEAVAIVYGVPPTLRWMYATQGIAAPFRHLAGVMGTLDPAPGDYAVVMAAAGIDAAVAYRWLLDDSGGWYQQDIVDGVRAAYRLTPDQAAALATSG
jgi:hypothetical protein